MKKIDITTKPDLADFDLDGELLCTLDVDKRTERGLEFGDLQALSLTSERVSGGVASTYPIEMADAVEDLAQRERSCCGSWLKISTERTGSMVRLEITADNPDGLDVILAMTAYSA